MSIAPYASAALPKPQTIAPRATAAAPAETGPHKLTPTDYAVGIGVPVVLSGLGAYATMRAARQATQAVAKMGGGAVGRSVEIMLGPKLAPAAKQAAAIAAKPGVTAAISIGMAGWMGWQALQRLHKDETITNPPDTHRTREASIKDGAIAGALALGGTAAAVMAIRAGGGAAEAGKTGKIFSEAAKAALIWGGGMGVVGGAAGALAGSTLREPEAAMDGVRDQAFRVGAKSAVTSGALSAVAGGGIAFLLTKGSPGAGKAVATAAVGSGLLGATYMGITSMSSSAMNHYASGWANSPKR